MEIFELRAAALCLPRLHSFNYACVLAVFIALTMLAKIPAYIAQTGLGMYNLHVNAIVVLFGLGFLFVWFVFLKKHLSYSIQCSSSLTEALEKPRIYEGKHILDLACGF